MTPKLRQEPHSLTGRWSKFAGGLDGYLTRAIANASRSLFVDEAEMQKSCRILRSQGYARLAANYERVWRIKKEGQQS